MSLYNVDAHNVYYVKWWAKTRKPLVIYVKTEKTFSPMSFIIYVVHF
ncbi:hypothetical protein QY73_000365 [Salmonella enterica subsp. enterica]|nr:hypothetical protein [Salmonella enterica subsp. enterica serovar Richmond]